MAASGPRACHCSLLCIITTWTKYGSSLCFAIGLKYNNSPSLAALRASSSRAITGTGADKRLELVPVPCLHVHEPRASEAANQALARLETAHCSTACLLNSVIAAPGDEMAVVHDVLLAKLELCTSKQTGASLTGELGWTYGESVHRTEARKPNDSLTRDTVDKEVLPGKQGLAEALSLGLLADVGGAGQKRVLADGPRLVPIEMQRDDVAKQGWAKCESSGSRIR